MRFACLALVAVAACTDAATTIANRCGQNNPPLDPSAPGLVVRVSVDAATTQRSAAGFCVRAERSDGTAFEALTDASGTATVPIDPAAGPWDVTAARFGYEAVSILNVDGPIAGALFTQLVGSGIGGNVLDSWGVDDGTKAHTLAVNLPSGGGPIRDWSVFDQNVPLTLYSASNGEYVFMEFFETSPSAPPFQLTAFSPSVGFFALPSLPRADQDMTVTLDQPSAPVPAKIVTDVDVEMPWPVTVTGLEAGYPVLRPCGSGAQHCRAPGLGTLSFLQTPATKMPWHIESFAAPLDGDSAVASFVGTLGDGSFVSLSLTTRSLGAPSTITVPDFQTTRIDGQHYADTRITTQADAYDRVAATFVSTPPPSFQTCPSCPIPDDVVWRVFTYRGATLTSRALPSLPAGMQISDLRGGGAFSDFIMGGTLSVMAGTDDAHPPWSSATLDGVATIIASK
ncbi:MAG TPA: hypothetical protein VLM85_15695 [Polyangiaceae bacterium]|nr:hypothetical protein [Polyangiaceae bacterium]